MDNGAWLALVQGPHAHLIKQGAEAKVYCVDLWTRAPQLALPNRATSACAPHTERVLIKHRFFKRYRHPALSNSVTASRTVSEARALVRCARHGVHVPRLVCVDETRGILGMEWIEGPSIRQWLGGLPEDGEEASHAAAPSEYKQNSAMEKIGEQLAQMHCADVIHGDLTTSNMMLRGADIVLIDFGLACVSSFWEDKAVDLYVLERAFASTHPSSEHLFHRVLEAYAARTHRTSPTAWPAIHARLQEVRMRGRKRSMVG